MFSGLYFLDVFLIPLRTLLFVELHWWKPSPTTSRHYLYICPRNSWSRVEAVEQTRVHGGCEHYQPPWYKMVKFLHAHELLITRQILANISNLLKCFHFYRDDTPVAMLRSLGLSQRRLLKERFCKLGVNTDSLNSKCLWKDSKKYWIRIYHLFSFLLEIAATLITLCFFHRSFDWLKALLSQ